MSDFVDIIIRAQDLAGGKIAKVAAELEALKISSSGASTEVDALGQRLGKLKSNAPDIGGTLKSLERMKDDAAAAEVEIDRLGSSLQQLDRNQRAASRIAPDQGPLSPQKLRANIKAVHELAAAENELFTTRKAHDQSLSDQNDALDTFVRQVERLKSETRGIGSSLRGEGLAAFGLAFQNLARDMETANFQFASTDEQIKRLTKSFEDLDSHTGGSSDEIARINALMTEQAINTDRAASSIKRLQANFAQARSDARGFATDARALGATSFASDLERDIAREAKAFNNQDTLRASLAQGILKLRLQGSEFDPAAERLTQRMHEIGTAEFQARLEADKFSQSVAEQRVALDRLARGVDPLSAAGRQITHMRQEIDSLEHPLTAAAQKARELGAAFNEENFPGGDAKKLQNIAKDGQQLGRELDKLGVSAQRGGTRFEQFEKDTSSLRRVFQTLGAKNATADLQHLQQTLQLSDVGTANLKLKQLQQSIHELGLEDTNPLKQRLAALLHEADLDIKRFTRDIENGHLELVRFEKDTQAFGRVLANAGFPQVGAQVDQIGNKAFRSAEGFSRMAEEFERSARQARLSVSPAMQKAALDLDRLKLRFQSAAIAADRLAIGMGHSIFSVEGAAARFTKLGSSLGVASTEMERLKSTTANSNGVIGIFLRTLTVWASRMAILVFAFTGLTGVIGPLVGTIGSLAGGVTSLVAAFSQLGSVLAGIPGALAAVGGSMLAIRSVLQPQGILTAVQGVLAAQRSNAGATRAATGGTGTGSTGTPIKDAQQALAQAEQSLHDLRITDRQQEQSAELNLQQARVQAAQQAIQAERDLIAVRAQAKLQEDQLRSDVQNAKASLSGLQQEGASPAAILAAQSDVRIAESALAQQQIDDTKKVGDAQQKLHDARVNGALAIKQAEQSLANTIRTNGEQEVRAQQAVAKATQNLADAQKGVGTAMSASGKQALTFGNQLQRALFGLDPVAKRLVFQILQLRTSFQGLTQGVRDRGYLVFSQFVSFLQSHLPQIVGVLNLFASAVTDVAEKFFHFVESPKVFSQIQELFIQSVPLVEKFGQALLPVIDAFIKIGIASVPFTNFLADGLVKISNFFDKLATGGIQSGSFAQFLNDSEETLTIVVHILEHFGGLINNVFHAASDSGQTLLQLFDNFLSRLEKITGTVAGQNHLSKFFEDQIPVMQAVGNLLVAIGKGFIDVTNALNKGPTGQNTLVDFLNRLSTGLLPFLVEFLTKFSAGIGGAFVNLIAAAGNLALALADLTKPMAALIDAAAAVTSGLSKLITFLEVHVPGVVQTVAALGFATLTFSKTAGPINVLLDSLLKKLPLVASALNIFLIRMRLLVIALLVLNQFVDVGSILSGVGDEIRSLGNFIGGLLQQLRFLKPVLDTSTLAFKALAIAITAALAFDAAAAFIGTVTAFKALGGIIGTLAIKLGIIPAANAGMIVSTNAVVQAINRQILATLQLQKVQLEAIGADEVTVAANAEQITSYEALTAAEEKAALGGGAKFGPAMTGLARIFKTVLGPVLILFSDTLIPALGSALVVLAGALGLPVEAVAALVAGLAILSIGLITNLFGIRDKAIAVAGQIVDFFKFQFGLLNDFFAAFHGDFSGLVKDAKTAAGKIKDFFVSAWDDVKGVFGGTDEFKNLIQEALAKARAVAAARAHEIGSTTTTNFLAGSATLSDKLPAQFRAAMDLVKAQVQADITALTQKFQIASTAISAILGAATETKLTPAQAKLNRLQREDELAALKQQQAQAKTQAEKDAAARALQEFRLQGQAQRENAQQSTLNQIQQAGQQLSLQNLEKYLSSTNVSTEAKFRALDTFLKKNHLTRADLMNQFGKNEGTKYFTALQKSLAPVRAMIKRLGTDVNVGLGIAGNPQLATPAPQQGHGPHSGLTDVTPGDARTLLLDRAKQLKISQQVIAQFGIIGKQAASGFIDGIGGGLAHSQQIISDHIAHNVLEPFKKVLGIASPSKVFRKIGNDVVDGFILGIGSLRHKFAVLWAKVGSDAASFFSQLAEFAKGKNGFSQFVKVMTQTVPAAFPGIRATMQKLWNGLLTDHDTFWDKFEKRLTKGWDSIHDLFTKTIPGTYDTVATSVGALWTRLGQGVNKGWKYITNQLFSWESDLLDTMNLILNRVGSKKLDKIAKPAQPQNNAPTDFASGGVPFVGNRGHGIVRAVPGGVYRVAEAGQHEAIISLDRKHRSRSLQIIEYALGNLGIPGFASGGITHPGKSEPRFGGITVGDPPTFEKVSGIVKQIAVAAATLVKTAADKWFGNSIMGSIGGPVPTYSVPTSAHIQHNIALGQDIAASKYGWTGGVFNALRSLWIGESGWNEFAYNASSGAQGIPQFLPGLPGRATPKGFPSNPPVDPKLQELWGMGYIHGRYGDPLTAFRLWLSRSPHWYHEGTPSVPGPKGADVPAVLQAGEMVLTQRHQALLGKLLFGNYMPNPPGAIGGGGGGGGIQGHFTEMAAYFKKLLAAVFKEVRGYLGAGSMPDFSIASGNFYSRTGLENGKGVIPIARRHMEFSHQMVRDVFNNSSYGLGAMLHELAHAFQLPSIIKRGKNWIEGGAELFMDRFGPSVFANLGPEHPAERRQYHAMLEEVLKEKTLVKRTTTRLKDGSLTSAEKARLTKQLKREKNHLGNLQDKAKAFLQDHPSANRKFHRILFHLAQAQVPAYERDLAGLRQEFDGDPSAVTKNQFHGGAAAALAKRLSLLDFQRLTKLNEIKTTKAEIARIAASGTDASSQQVLTNLQAILARLGVNVANLLRTEMAFMQAHPILRKQFPKLYRQLLGIDGGGGGSAGLPLPGPIGQPVLPSFRAGGEVTGYSRRFGDPVTIQAHVGEWVVNPEQQARLAATLGGWQEAKRFLFSTVTPDPMRSSFAVGGPIAGGRGTQAGHGTTVNQHVTINTASPKVDIDYVSRVLEARMGRF